MIGRVDEAAVVAAAIDRAAAGSGRLLVVEGEAGIGKTRLVAEAVAGARRHDFEICAAAVDEVERRRPFGVLADALGVTRHASDPARVDVAHSLHGDGTVASPQPALEFRVSEAIVGLVERLCARGPVLLVLEDVHWADPSTRACLARLGRIVPQLPLLLLVTARPLPRSARLASLLDGLAERGAERIPLGPLPDGDLPALAEAVVGASPGPRLRRQLARAGGNPLLLIELLALLAEDGAIVRTDGVHADVEDDAVSATLSLTILHRLSFLTPATLDLLGMASILGSTFSVADLRLLSGRPAAALAGPLKEALAAGALAEREDRLAFRHELIRDALYSDMPASVRGAMHRDLARALASAGHPPGRVAEHLLRGAAPGDGEAVDWLRKAAAQAGQRAPTVAVELLEHALRLADPADPVHGHVAAELAVALMFAGRDVEGEAACRDVLARRAHPESEGALRWLLLRTMLIRGRAAEALEHIDRALALCVASGAERAHYRASASFARLVLGELDVALELAEEAIELAGPTGDALAVSESLHAKAQVLLFQGRITESADLAVRAVEALDHDEAPRGPQTATATAGLMLVASDRVVEGREMLRRGLGLNEGLGARSGLALNHVALADAMFLVGEWDDAASEIAATTELVGDGPAWPVMSFGILAVIAVHRDELDTAQAHLGAARAALAAGAGAMRAQGWGVAGALVTAGGGRPADALTMLGDGWDRLAAAGIGSAFPELGPALVRRLVAAGQTARAAEVAAAVGGCADDNPGVATIAGAALLCRGLAGGAPDLLLEAVDAYRAGAHPLGRALACEDAAAALVIGGRGVEARAHLGEADDIYGALGAARGTARVAAALRRLGARRGSRAPRTRAGTGWDALTVTERKVAALVARRLSNPEIAERMFLSRRTVETHVSHVLAKLGVRSRFELAAAVTRREPV
ncbi:MAG: AAA family ATPase [Pseudonocardia sp.]|nr:AAA family ATPase [Pseudonocardia sp.]